MLKSDFVFYLWLGFFTQGLYKLPLFLQIYRLDFHFASSQLLDHLCPAHFQFTCML